MGITGITVVVLRMTGNTVAVLGISGIMVAVLWDDRSTLEDYLINYQTSIALTFPLDTGLRQLYGQYIKEKVILGYRVR